MEHQTNMEHPTSQLFIRVPNYIIQHSLQTNKYILPLYLYSGVHHNPNYFDIVDTNLSLISETFAPSNPSAPGKFSECLSYLTQDIPDTEELPGFSMPFQLYTNAPIKSFSKTSRIQYIFLNRSCKMDSGWTKLTYDEYFYILDRIDTLNQTKSAKGKYNTIELLNLYLYFKQKINLYTNTQQKLKESGSINSLTKITMHESLDTICKNTALSRNTLTKYTNQLIELGLISINRGTFNNNNSAKEPNEYSLSNKWLEYYKTDE